MIYSLGFTHVCYTYIFFHIYSTKNVCIEISFLLFSLGIRHLFNFWVTLSTSNSVHFTKKKHFIKSYSFFGCNIPLVSWLKSAHKFVWRQILALLLISKESHLCTLILWITYYMNLHCYTNSIRFFFVFPSMRFFLKRMCAFRCVCVCSHSLFISPYGISECDLVFVMFAHHPAKWFYAQMQCEKQKHNHNNHVLTLPAWMHKQQTNQIR